MFFSISRFLHPGAFRAALSAVLLCAAGALAAEEINSVSFQQSGDYRFGDDILKYNVQSRKGSVYDERVVNDDMKRLHGTGFFSDVFSETVKRPDGTIDLIFKVSPKPTVRSVSFRGNQKYDSKKLAEQISLTVGAPLNDKRLSESIVSLREFYKKNGLNDVTLFPVQKRTLDGGVDVIFDIKENLKLKVNSVTFPGVKVFSESELRSSIANRSSWFSWMPFLDLGLLDKNELQEDMVRLREKYADRGYLDFNVKQVQMNPDPKNPEYIDLVFETEEGEPYTVGRVSVRGGQRFANDELLQRVGLVPGEIFSSGKERRSITAIEQRYTPLGYVDFTAKAVRLPDFRTHTVDVVIDVQEGIPYKVRDVFITGNKWTKDHVIRRELAIAPGDPVDRERIDASKNRLMGMGYFDKVDAVSVNSPESGTKDVDIRVKEKNFLNAKIGGGFSDTDNIAGMIELSHSNMDILDPANYFTGGGQRARLIALVGIEHMDFEADFTEPWLFGIPLRWDLSGYLRNVVYDKWEEERIGVTTSLTKRVFDDFTSVTGGYTFEHVRVHRMDDGLSDILESQKGGSLVGRVQAAIDRDTRDNAINPTSGYNVNLLGAVTSRIFGATNDYYRLEAKGINYYSFFDKMLILSTAGKIGTIGTIGDPHKDPPLYERYFLGGGDSIRGFPYREVGPVDNNEDVYGGNFMYLFTTELTHPIWDFIRGAVFVDIGNATHSRLGFANPNIGVGYGLRLRLPMVNAPIRLDLAYPVLNNQEGVDSTLRFHFNMGFSLF